MASITDPNIAFSTTVAENAAGNFGINDTTLINQVDDWGQRVLAEIARVTAVAYANATAINNELTTELAAIKANNWVTTVRINAGAVTNTKIANGAVRTAHIQNAQVTDAKLALNYLQVASNTELVVSDSAPSNSDGKPDGTIHFEY